MRRWPPRNSLRYFKAAAMVTMLLRMPQPPNISKDQGTYFHVGGAKRVPLGLLSTTFYSLSENNIVNDTAQNTTTQFGSNCSNLTFKCCYVIFFGSCDRGPFFDVANFILPL